MVKNKHRKVDKGERKKRATTIYPKYTLTECLKLAESIRDNNRGEPYNRIDLAQSIGLSPESSTFRILITASNKYGLTEGSYIAEKISLTDLGKKIVSPTTDEEKSQGILTSLYNVEFYKNFFTKFLNYRLPRKDLLLNTLEREFNIPYTDREQCYDLLIKNATELNLLKDISGTLYVRFDSPVLSEKQPSESLEGLNPPPLEDGKEGEKPKNNDMPNISDPKFSIKDIPEQQQIDKNGVKSHKPIIFVSHSKNMRILNQIKSNLEFGGFSYKIAIETETTAIPIPEKIFGMMRDCNCAIVNVSADEPEKRADGSYGINDNVLVEIGGAFLAYNQRVILLVDKRLSLPSNLQGLYRCEYEGEELDSIAITKLQKGLLQFRVPVD
jgi:hypothetical protein